MDDTNVDAEKTPSFSILSKQQSVKSQNSPIPSIKESAEADLPIIDIEITTSPVNKMLSPANSPRATVKTSVDTSLRYDMPKNTSPPRSVQSEPKSPRRLSIRSDRVEEAFTNLEPQGKYISEHVEELTNSIKNLSKNVDSPKSPALHSNLNKIATMSKVLTNEANALRESIKSLSADIVRTKNDLYSKTKDATDYPYHLFLLEIIINKIHMKCDCFEMDYNNLVISATFLGKQPIILYDSSYGKIENFSKLNAGKSSLFAMTYDKICSIDEFEIVLQLTKQPPCTHCVTRLGESRLNYTQEYMSLREELCKKWSEQQPKDNILCTTSTPLLKNQFYLLCGDGDNSEPIGCIEVTVRMSFLGKEITTAFCVSPKPQGTSLLLKEDNGIMMYSCQKVEMDDQGKIFLDEDVLEKKSNTRHTSMSESSTFSKQLAPKRNMDMERYTPPPQAGLGEFRIRDLNDEINKLMREKRHWEVQIKSLGGPDHARVGPKMLDQDGKEVPGNRGYKYFGAAKDLPGVRELFEQEPPPPPRRTRADLMRDVDADYYGYRDDDDGLLIPLEREAELESIARAVDEWKANKEQNQDQVLPDEENIYPEDPDDKRIDDDSDPIVTTVTSHVAVPSQKDIEEALLRKKKQELLEQYGCLDVKLED